MSGAPGLTKEERAWLALIGLVCMAILILAGMAEDRGARGGAPDSSAIAGCP